MPAHSGPASFPGHALGGGNPAGTPSAPTGNKNYAALAKALQAPPEAVNRAIAVILQLDPKSPAAVQRWE